MTGDLGAAHAGWFAVAQRHQDVEVLTDPLERLGPRLAVERFDDDLV